MKRLYRILGLPRGRKPLNYGVTIGRLGHRRFRFPLSPMDIGLDPMVNKSGPGPIHMDVDVMGPFEPFIILDILESVRLIYDDINALIGRS